MLSVELGIKVMNFSEWLRNELKQRGWSQTELASRAGLATGTISNILADRRNPDHGTLIKFAKGLTLPVETVYAAAGYLPNRNPRDASFNQILDLMKNMTEEERKELLSYALWKFKKEQ